MSTPSIPRDPDELAVLRTEVAALRGELRRHTAPAAPRPRRLPRRLLPLTLVALLVVLTPLVTVAANPFTDLVPGSVHNANIDAIYNAGVTTGCVPNAQYCPTDNVTRQEMASFLARLGGLGANPPVANAKTAQTATNATQLGGIPAASYVQTTNPGLPIAFATVSTSGIKLSGTANVSVTRTGIGHYSIAIAGVNYFYADYTTLATIIGTGEIATDSVGGALLINTASSAGAATDHNFQFVVFKP